MSEETRPFTDAERRYVEWWARTGGLPSGPTAKDHVLVGCYGAGCLTILAYAAVAVVFKILLSIQATHLVARRMQGHEGMGYAAFALPLVLWIGMLIYLFTRRRKVAPEAEDPKMLIRRDLDGGVARIHRFRATDVLVAHADEHRERNYFVRLDDGRVLFLGPWRPPGCELQGLTFLPDEKGFPSSTFEIAATPNYLLILEVVGSGDFLRPSDEFEMNEEEDVDRCRLEPGRFVKTPWEEIRKNFG